MDGIIDARWLDSHCFEWWCVVFVLIVLLARKDLWRLLRGLTGRNFPPDEPGEFP